MLLFPTKWSTVVLVKTENTNASLIWPFIRNICPTGDYIVNILFTSVVGPYGTDTEWSSYKNPMSLLTNQVTRGQMYFQPEMFNNTYAFDLFAANINANCAILDFPSVTQLTKVLKSGKWDRVGISAIIPNFNALLKTYQIIRSVLPNVSIDVGGHITNDESVLEEIKHKMLETTPTEKFHTYTTKEDAVTDTGTSVTFIKMDGLDYYEHLNGVGLKNDKIFYEPLPRASVNKRAMGLPLSETSGGMILLDVGCPMKCDFCSTSHKFGGKFTTYLKTAEDIMKVANAHEKLGRTEMFIMSENFSLDHERLLKLLKLMEEQKKPYTYSIFSSAQSLVKLGVENIIKLGFCFIWIGLEESTGTTYDKMQNIDLKKLVRDLQEHGVEVLGSTILGFEHQQLSDLDKEINNALTYECVYNQFMLFMPIPGTVLWDKMKIKGTIKKDFPWIHVHGQSVQNWNHPNISDTDIEAKLDNAFKREFETLGPSIYRMIKVHRDGYLKTADWDHELVQMRRAKMKKTFLLYVPVLHAMYKDLKRMGHSKAAEVNELKKSLIKITGLRGFIYDQALSPYIKLALKREKRRFRKNLKLKRKASPKCVLTHYGKINNTYPAGIPKPRLGSDVVEITKNI